jgi:hypothetical protein
VTLIGGTGYVVSRLDGVNVWTSDLTGGGMGEFLAFGDPKQMGGVPCIRSLRVPVATVVGMVADGTTTIDILAASRS